MAAMSAVTMQAPSVVAISELPLYYPEGIDPDLVDTIEKEIAHQESSESEKIPTMEQQGRIVGGHTASFQEYPYYVRLDDASGNGKCGGSLIAPDIVLSAAHCHDHHLSAAVNGFTQAILANGAEVNRQIVRKVQHPMFNSRTYEYDYMLLKLDQPVTTIEPVQLNFDFNNPVDGDMLTVIGLGATAEKAGFPIYLNEVDVKKVSQAQCAGNYGYGSIANIFEQIMMCAGMPDGGKDACQGDSGKFMTASCCGFGVDGGVAMGH